MTDDNTETLGDTLGPGVTKDDLADTERVLERFTAVAVDEFDCQEKWLTTAHSAVTRALEHYDSELGGGGCAPNCTGRLERRHPPSEMVKTNDDAESYKCLRCDTVVSFAWTEITEFPEHEREKMDP